MGIRHETKECPCCGGTARWQDDIHNFTRTEIIGGWYTCIGCKVKFKIIYEKEKEANWREYKDVTGKQFGIPDPTVQGPSYSSDGGRLPAPPPPQVDAEDLWDINKGPGRAEPKFPSLHKVKEGEFNKQSYMNYGGTGKPLKCNSLKEGGCVYFCHTDSWIARQIGRFWRSSNPYKRNVGK